MASVERRWIPSLFHLIKPGISSTDIVPEGCHGTEAAVHTLFALVVEVVHVTAQEARQAMPDGQGEGQAVAAVSVECFPKTQK